MTDEPLPYFAGIVPCGITDGGVTTVERLTGRRFALEDVTPPVLAHFGEVFGREIIRS